jgi:hypothetical protein
VLLIGVPFLFFAAKVPIGHACSKQLSGEFRVPFAMGPEKAVEVCIGLREGAKLLKLVIMINVRIIDINVRNLFPSFHKKLTIYTF